ncbi:DUF5675 family protein [Lutibacter maritimus]|uniref:DUF5675 domain-containing protein n=1 Tax=Lutibacter maritimus TaxID=593133 RepID=A0A1I6NSL2_9FLAO|nr:DUF5675 family protein [Lutibacter maritimus]SFS30890.1 hypothetical protein SAMN04488006_0501 [Lutibacter maritimus]
MKAKLIRLVQEAKQTLDAFLFFDDDVNLIFECKALELPDRNNDNSISRVPEGKYTCKLRYSEKYGWHYILLNVKGRELILIHFGNYYTDTRGCIIVGNAFTDINGDGFRDVTSSKKTLKRILEIAPAEFELIIVNE